MTRKENESLNLLLKMSRGTPRRKCRGSATLRPIIALLLAAWVIAVAGCHAKDASPPTAGSAGSGPAAQKPTAEQEAAKQRGEQKGAAIQAANQAATGTAPGGQ